MADMEGVELTVYTIPVGPFTIVKGFEVGEKLQVEGGREVLVSGVREMLVRTEYIVSTILL